MAYKKLPEKETVLLVRALGLLVNQAGIYGPSHKVTQDAARSVFAELEQAVKTYGPIELVLKDDLLLLNGTLDGLDAVSGKNLAERMALHKIGGLLFLPPADLDEFLTCVALFGTPPAALTAQGGFEAALKKADLRSVQAVAVTYQRVTEQKQKPSPPPAPEPAAPQAKPKAPRRPAAEGTNLADMTAAWERTFGTAHPAAEGRTASARPLSASQTRAAHLAALLRDTAALLEEDSALSDEEQHRRVLVAVTRIRDELIASTAESERQIAALADQLDEDRQTIASIESAARRRGIGIKLTRAELVERYAELNQEIVQPLTVSTGVIDLLGSGRSGPLTASQRDMLRLAAESVDRVNQLVAYMRRIAGLPDSYTPDNAIIADSYR
jgi:hypothetical protein